MPGAAFTTVVDPDGQAIDLTEERWAHITDGHPELTSFRGEVLATVREPDRRLAPNLGGSVVLQGERRAESLAQGRRTL
jgi:hypothetical protein